MSARRLALAIGLFAVAAACWQSDAWARKDPLLDVAAGQIPDDTGSDGATKMTIEDSPQLGGKALKVEFAAGDSFGVRAAKVRNWKPYISLEFEAFNPEKGDVGLQFSVKHKRTTTYQTRVEHAIALKPGKNAVKIGVDELSNVNGSAPDLSDVARWYFNCTDGKARTLYFGDIFLVGDDAAPAAGGAAGAAHGNYRVTGKIGEMNVELLVQPQGAVADATSPVAAAARAAKPPAGDPARLARIRAAKMPPIAKPVMFDTPEADAIVSALEVFPPDNPWNQVVEDWPLHRDSKRIIASIGIAKPLRGNADMAYILVPPEQKRIDLKTVAYPAESDKGPFPIPDNMPIEGWPVGYQRDASPARKLTLDELQRDKLNENGDRHAIVVDPINRILYEFYQAKKTPGGWQAAQSSVFDLKSNKLRPDGWTSTDAAGLPIFPAIVRYDELRRGAVEHAMRVTVVKTRRAYVAPATHFASKLTSDDLPRMGERIRLRRDFDVSGFSPEVQAILKGLKKYGMLVADNGIDWAISVAPDPRIPVLHEELRKVKGADFEVVESPK